jgi:hypothetical protein
MVSKIVSYKLQPFYDSAPVSYKIYDFIKHKKAGAIAFEIDSDCREVTFLRCDDFLFFIPHLLVRKNVKQGYITMLRSSQGMLAYVDGKLRVVPVQVPLGKEKNFKFCLLISLHGHQEKISVKPT